MRLSRAELDSFRDATVPDLLPAELRLLFVGINPGLRSAAVQSHFAPRGNRFFPALFRAGIVDRPIDASQGLSPGDREHLLERGIGITNLVHRATAGADELGPGELAAGARELEERVPELAPRAVAILGIGAYRLAFARPGATVGRQPDRIGDTGLWVVPNPSGRNAHDSPESLARAYREVAAAAGVELSDPPSDSVPSDP